MKAHDCPAPRPQLSLWGTKDWRFEQEEACMGDGADDVTALPWFVVTRVQTGKWRLQLRKAGWRSASHSRDSPASGPATCCSVAPGVHPVSRNPSPAGLPPRAGVEEEASCVCERVFHVHMHSSVHRQGPYELQEFASHRAPVLPRQAFRIPLF